MSLVPNTTVHTTTQLRSNKERPEQKITSKNPDTKQSDTPTAV